MGKTPWTPGPWIAVKGAGWCVTRPDAAARREAAIMVGMTPSFSLVATPTWQENDAEAKANAILIAEAPAMAEALEALLHVATVYRVGEVDTAEARAVLARIKGEA